MSTESQQHSSYGGDGLLRRFRRLRVANKTARAQGRMATSSPLVSISFRQVAAPTLVRRSRVRTLRYDSSLPASLVEALWRAPEALLAAGTTLRKTEKLRMTTLVEWDSQAYVMKHYGRRSLRHSLKHAFAGSQARQSFEAGCALADAGVPTPRPVAAVDNCRRGFDRDSYLVYPYVEGCALFDAVRKGTMSDARIGEAIRELKGLWRQLIALRVGLRDANTGNFIVTPQGDLWLIDLDDCRFHHLSLVARRRLHRRWCQLSRNLRRTKQTRDGRVMALRRAA